MQALRPLRRALLSVSDKKGLVEFAAELVTWNIEILATGGTATTLKRHGIPVTEVADFTGFPQILAGRVKSLHPKIHGGLLARRGIDDAEIATHDISPIDLLVVNLYPFQQTITNSSSTFQEAIENIDVGGPSMLRAGAKNFSDVTVVTDPQEYQIILQELRQFSGATSIQTRLHLAQKTFHYLAAYDANIAHYLAQQTSTNSSNLFSDCYQPIFRKRILHRVWSASQ